MLTTYRLATYVRLLAPCRMVYSRNCRSLRAPILCSCYSQIPWDGLAHLQGNFTRRPGPKSAYATSGDWMTHQEAEAKPSASQQATRSQALQPTGLGTPFGTSKAEELNFSKGAPPRQAYAASSLVRPSVGPRPLIRNPEEAPVVRKRAAGGLSGYAQSANVAHQRPQNVDLKSGEQRKALFDVGGSSAGAGGFHFDTS